MRSKKKLLGHFSRALSSQSLCFRPENEHEIYMDKTPALARGAGLSYSDSCFNTDGAVIETQRLNHLISFDTQTGIVVCQAGVTFKDLLLLSPEFIPPVLPGTLHATLAGGLAHDVHGKNNHREHSFGHHVLWCTLLIQGESIHCSREEHADLFYATIGGLGLTGIITRLAIRLKKASHAVTVKKHAISSLPSLLEQMSTEGLDYDYQVAWIDLLHKTPRGILSLANHCPITAASSPDFCTKGALKLSKYSIPKIPFSVIQKWGVKLFNHCFFHQNNTQETCALEAFNNPLDKIKHWNYLYGSKGLIQFQAVFNEKDSLAIIEHLIALIQRYKAVPILAVLKLFTYKGEGLLSFCKPGFTLAIDFKNNAHSIQAIKAMNAYISEVQGRVYLAKDLLLSSEQYQKMNEQHTRFSQTLVENQCNMKSDLAIRLGVVL